MPKGFQKASKKLSHMSHQIHNNYKFCFSPDSPAELMRCSGFTRWNSEDILSTNLLFVGLCAPSEVEGCDMLGCDSVSFV